MLLKTLAVTICLIYSYSALTANYYSDKFNDDFENIDVCQSLASCFVYSLNAGLRNGGGIADSMGPYDFGDSKFGLKILFDLTYFILINTIILNIVFGIIVDTFGDMRDEQFRRAEVVENTCLVCLNEKKDILECKLEFDDHITHQHNIWNYVYFINYLKHKRLIDFSGPELEAWNSSTTKQHDWLPFKESVFLNKSTLLDEDSRKEELVAGRLAQINLKTSKIMNKLDVASWRIIDQVKNEMLRVISGEKPV